MTDYKSIDGIKRRRRQDNMKLSTAAILKCVVREDICKMRSNEREKQ
jgi:hypothetical protein